MGQSAGSVQPMSDPYKAAAEGKNEVYLRVTIAETMTTWIHRFGAPRVLAAMREWLDYVERTEANA